MTDLETRFWSKVEKGEDCWMWKATIGDGGYGQFYFGGRMRKAHRCSWEIEHGESLGKLMVFHTCKNRACVRPSHLFTGTMSERPR